MYLLNMKRLKRLLILLYILLSSMVVFGQTKLRDSVYVKTDIFEVMYSETLQQPLWVKYSVECPKGTESRKGLDFYICDSIITSDDLDYAKNIYDKGHMAPAASFNCDKVTLFKTFTYLNSALQHQDLNRITWRNLESYERLLGISYSTVKIEIKCIYSNSSIKLPTGATVPDAFIKTIYYGNKVETYYFKNEKPKSNDFKKYRIK